MALVGGSYEAASSDGGVTAVRVTAVVLAEERSHDATKNADRRILGDPFWGQPLNR